MTRRDPTKWVPLEGLPEGAHRWGSPELRDMEQEWGEVWDAIGGPDAWSLLKNWREERFRAFAIENGQIENHYTLRQGVTEKLIAEGVQGVMGYHTLEGLPDWAIQGLLQDQVDAFQYMFDEWLDHEPFTTDEIRTWHFLLACPQETIKELRNMSDGKLMRPVDFLWRYKSPWKTIPNNRRRPDGRIHEYCPPEQVQSEMDRFIDLYWEEICGRRHAVEVQAAWMHHSFTRTNPFQDGNGCVARMLMAYIYVDCGLPPPIISARTRPAYFNALEDADRGDLKAFSDYLGDLAKPELREIIQICRKALAGELERPIGKGGRIRVDH